MDTLTERLEIRVGPQTARQLREAARLRGVSVGQVVREAIARWIGDDSGARMRAVDALCAVEAPVADWEEMEQEIVAAHRAGDA